MNLLVKCAWLPKTTDFRPNYARFWLFPWRFSDFLGHFTPVSGLAADVRMASDPFPVRILVLFRLTPRFGRPLCTALYGIYRTRCKEISMPGLPAIPNFLKARYRKKEEN